HDEVLGDKIKAPDIYLHSGIASQHDHRSVSVERAYLLEEHHPRHDRHLEIGNHEQGPARREDLYAHAAVAGEQAVVARRDEDLVKDFAHLTVIVNNQDVPMRHVM